MDRMTESTRSGFLDLYRRLSPEKRPLLLAALDVNESEAVDGDWPSWAHDGQMCPPGDWRSWVIMAGRGYGKTRAGAEWVAAVADATPGARIALVAATIEEARAVMIDGQSGLMAVAGDIVHRFYPARRVLAFTNGAEAYLYSGASPEALRGPEHHAAWCDELAKWRQPRAAWDMLQLGLRLGERPRAIVTTTPRPGAALAEIMAEQGCVVTRGRTHDNPHLPTAFVQRVSGLYSGTRLGRQEIDGELLPDVAGALWTVETIERCRIAPPQPARGDYARVVIGVDPPSGDGTCGIVACALGADGMGYVLADHSVTARSAEGWARAVAAAAMAHGAQMIVAETNQGGTMVEAVLHAVDHKLRVKAVNAMISKSDRATPIATAFEAGKVGLCGEFPELEAELCGLVAGGGYEGPGRSPDRADAMVWALSELLPVRATGAPRVKAF